MAIDAHPTSFPASELGLFSIHATQRDGQRCFFSCVGELDGATAPILRAALESTDSDVLLDFAGVSFLDSTGMGVLAAQRERLAKQGCTLRVSALQDGPRRALEITGLLYVLARGEGG